jgi:hypothetical protein
LNYQTALIQLPLLVQEKTGAKILGPADVQRVCEDMRDMAQECVHVLTLLCRARHNSVYAEYRIMPREDSRWA